MRVMIKILPFAAAVVLALTLMVNGCSRQSNAPARSQINAPTNQSVDNGSSAAASAMQAQAAPESASLVQADGQPNLAELDRVARLWMYRNHRRPTSWEDFAANAGVQIPPAPPGKKYALSKSMHVSLVDR